MKLQFSPEWTRVSCRTNCSSMRRKLSFSRGKLFHCTGKNAPWLSTNIHKASRSLLQIYHNVKPNDRLKLKNLQADFILLWVCIIFAYEKLDKI